MTARKTKTSLPPGETRFDWVIYRNATLAGLSILIPVPLVDWMFEEAFRRSMPGIIAHRNGLKPPKQALNAFNRGQGSIWDSCLSLPVKLVFELIKRLSRKILYFLTIKEATDKVNLYWHQAYLLNHLSRRGHLNNETTALAARLAVEHTLRTTSIGPLERLAYDVVSGSRNIFTSLRRARRGHEDAVIAQKKTRLQHGWKELSGDLQMLAAAYDQIYPQVYDRLTRPPVPPAA